MPATINQLALYNVILNVQLWKHEILFSFPKTVLSIIEETDVITIFVQYLHTSLGISTYVHGQYFSKASISVTIIIISLLQIFKDSDYYYLDGSDTSVANWMRYVASAYSLSVMNLVACQHQEHIYFYTIR